MCVFICFICVYMCVYVWIRVMYIYVQSLAPSRCIAVKSLLLLRHAEKNLSRCTSLSRCFYKARWGTLLVNMHPSATKSAARQVQNGLLDKEWPTRSWWEISFRNTPPMRWWAHLVVLMHQKTRWGNQRKPYGLGQPKASLQKISRRNQRKPWGLSQPKASLESTCGEPKEKLITNPNLGKP